MQQGYFQRVLSNIGTEFWINNPSGRELSAALRDGAVGVASNPVYIHALLASEPEFVHAVLDRVIRDAPNEDDAELAMKVIEGFVARPSEAFQPLFHESNGRFGYVAIQGNPRRNHSLKDVLSEAERFHALGENIIIKLPATIEGASAMEELTARGWPTIGTMSFSVSQYVFMAEAHRRGLLRTTKKPRCLVTMLPGLLDEYLRDEALRRGFDCAPERLRHAGVTTARAAYEIQRKRGYEAMVLSGGARSTYHWSELMGKDIGITLGGALMEVVSRERPALDCRIKISSDTEVVSELRESFPDFVLACDEGALSPDEFRQYGPVARFQESFLKGFERLLQEIQSRRQELQTKAEVSESSESDR